MVLATSGTDPVWVVSTAGGVETTGALTTGAAVTG